MLLESDWDFKYSEVTLGGIEEDALRIDGKTIVLPIDAGYDDVYSMALEFLPLCQQKFGFTYSDIKIIGSGGKHGFYQIIYYDASQSYPYYQNGQAIMNTNAYLRLSIYSNIGGSDIITLCSIAYKDENNSFTEGTHYNTITLSEAEIMLKNGYVFGGHTCPLCMAEQDSIDFSDYDLVGIEYVERLGDDGRTTNELFPFYAFYKKVKEGSYARTYVPAFRVSGLEEYFESRKNIHE